MNNYYEHYFKPNNPSYENKTIWFDYTWGQTVLHRNDTTEDSYVRDPWCLHNIQNQRYLFEQGALWDESHDDEHLDNICNRFLLTNESYTQEFKRNQAEVFW